jgi:hypothetical protein
VPSRERDERSPALTPTIAPAARPPHAQAFEPLSPCRYKVSFTASRGLKEKLELARDLMRHSVPGGEIAAIMERALDLLIADVMKTRFGSGARQKRSASSKQTPSAPPQTTPPPEFAENAKRPEQSAQPPPPATDQHSNRPETIPRALRRAVLERDGLRCTWRGPDGTRCTARAWLERDHIHPRSLGGATHLQNLRHLCKAHNRRAAEHVHGEHHIERAIHRKRRTAPTPPPHATMPTPPKTPASLETPARLLPRRPLTANRETKTS